MLCFIPRGYNRVRETNSSSQSAVFEDIVMADSIKRTCNGAPHANRLVSTQIIPEEGRAVQIVWRYIGETGRTGNE
jgi:hypothetical protein